MNELETAPSAPSALAQRLYRRLAEPAGVIQTQQLPGRQTQAAAQSLIQRSQLPTQVQSRYGAVGIIQPNLEVPVRSRVESLGGRHFRSPELAQPPRDIGEVIGLPTLEPASPDAWPSSGDSSVGPSSLAPVLASAPSERSGGAFRVSRRVASELLPVAREATTAPPLESAPLSLAAPAAGMAMSSTVGPGTVGAIARSPDLDVPAPAPPHLTPPDRPQPFRGRVQRPSEVRVMRQAESATVIPSPAAAPLPMSPLPLAAPGLQRSPGLPPEAPDDAPSAMSPALLTGEAAASAPVQWAEGRTPLPVRAELRSPTTAPVVTVQRQVEAADSSSVALPLAQSPTPVLSSGAVATPQIMATMPSSNAGGAQLTLARQPLPGMGTAAAPAPVLPQGLGPKAAIAAVPLTLHTPAGGGVIAREPMDSLPTVATTPATPAPPPPAPPTGSTSETSPGPDIKQLAEQVSRILHRQLTVERERRGISQW